MITVLTQKVGAKMPSQGCIITCLQPWLQK
jgi:hypothetical protein